MRASSTTHGPQESQGSAATRTRLRRTQGAWMIDLIIMMVLVALPPGIGAAPGPETNSTPHDSKPHGLTRRTPWTTSRVVGTPEPSLPFTTRPFRPELALKNPVFVISEPGTRNLLVVLQGGEAERPSRIVRIAEVPKATAGTGSPAPYRVATRQFNATDCPIDVSDSRSQSHLIQPPWFPHL